MKKLLFFCAVAASVGLAASADAQTASKASRNNSRATATITRTNRSVTRQQRAAQSTFTTTPRVDGVITRTVRSDNPLQMINPAAPAEYGSGRDVARHEVDDPFQRPYGLKLVTVEF